MQDGLQTARGLGDANLIAVLLNNIGNLFTHQDHHGQALEAYRESDQQAQTSGNRLVAAQALTNASRASIQLKQYQEAKTLLHQTEPLLRDLEASHESAYLLINNGLSANTLRTHIAPAAQIESLTLLAAERFQAAGTMADTLSDDRAASYAWGYLGGLYEEEQRYQEALQLTRRARSAAQRIQAPESLYRWQWQTGRLLEAQGHIDEAIVAYQQAVNTLQSFRQEMIRGIGSGASTSLSGERW